MRKFTLLLLYMSFLSCLFHGCRLDEIAPATLADFEILGGPVHIQGEVITFENTSSYYTTGASFTWNFGDGTVVDSVLTTSSMTHTYDTTGTYTIILTAHKATIEGEDAYSTTKDTTITISAIALPDPIAAFAAIPDSIPCVVPCMVRFVDQSQNHDSTMNVWDFRDGKGSSTETSPIYTYDSVGMYMPKLTIVNAQGKIDSVDSVAIIVINPEEDMPEALFNMDDPDNCMVAPCTFVLNNMSMNADSFFWDYYADGSTDTITTNTNPFPFYTTEWGLIRVKLTAKNNNGNMAMYMDSAFLATPDTPIAFFTINVNPCTAPCNAVFSNSSQGANFIEMDYGDSTPVITQPVAASFFHSYSDTGMYVVTMTAIVLVNNNPYTDTHRDTIHIIPPPPPPVADFTYSIQGNTVAFTNESLNASSYVWNFSDGNSSTDLSPQYTYAGPGNYPVQLTAFNSLGDFDTITKVVLIIPSCTDSTYERRIGNPSRDRILAVAAHQDGGFMLAGSAIGNSLGVTEAGWLVHVDACGDTVWMKEYTLNGSQFNRFHSITPRPDGGGFVLGGYANVNSASSRNGWILKINNDGSEVWNQAVTYLNWHSIHIEEIIANPNPSGGYLATGRASEFTAIPDTNIQNRDGFLMQINDLGMSATTSVDIIEDQSLNPYLESYFKAMYANSSGDVFFAGHLRPNATNPDWQARFVRYNLASNTIVVDTAFGDLNEDEQLFDIIEDPDGNLVMCGSHNSTNFWMVKMDNMGANRQEGSITLSESSSTAENITMTQDQMRYALTGFAGNRRAFLIVVNLSMNTLFINRRYGTSGDDRGREILLTSDGGYFIGGVGENSTNGDDAFYIRTDINGLTQ